MDLCYTIGLVVAVVWLAIGLCLLWSQAKYSRQHGVGDFGLVVTFFETFLFVNPGIFGILWCTMPTFRDLVSQVMSSSAIPVPPLPGDSIGSAIIAMVCAFTFIPFMMFETFIVGIIMEGCVGLVEWLGKRKKPCSPTPIT